MGRIEDAGITLRDAAADSGRMESDAGASLRDAGDTGAGGAMDAADSSSTAEDAAGAAGQSGALASGAGEGAVGAAGAAGQSGAEAAGAGGVGAPECEPDERQCESARVLRVCDTDGSWRSVPCLEGCKDNLCLASQMAISKRAQDLVVDDTFVYWSTSFGEIWKRALADRAIIPEPVQLAVVAANGRMIQNPSGLALLDNQLYFAEVLASGAAIDRLNLASLQITALATMQYGPQQVVIHQSKLYWPSRRSNQSSIMTAQLDGSGIVPFAGNQTGPLQMAVDASGVYWTNDDGKVKRSTGLSPEETLHDDSADIPRSIALDSTNVYWTTTRGSIQRLAKNGREPKSIHTGALNGSIVVADGFVYVGSTRGIEKLRADADNPTAIMLARAEAETRRTVRAVDKRFVYWVEYESARVMRVEK